MNALCLKKQEISAFDIRIAAKEALIGSPEAWVNSSVTGGGHSVWFKILWDPARPGSFYLPLKISVDKRLSGSVL